MTVKEVPVNIRCLEYRQEKGDKNYGSCLYARFYFNLDKYELNIISDCGNYAYKWVETPEHESFLQLMARIGEEYLLHKLCGEPKEFDYEATKEHCYKWFGEDDEDREILDRIFENIEYDYEPQTGDDFIRLFDEENYEEGRPKHAYFSDTWELPVYVYTADQKKICKIFKEKIQPIIWEIVSKEG